MLLKGVREVASLAKPAEPTAATQRAFDAERERSPVHAHVPPARRVTEQLRLPWAEVLAVAHAPERTQNKLLAVKTREPEQDWLTEDHAATVLGLVAARLGKESLSQSEYRVSATGSPRTTARAGCTAGCSVYPRTRSSSRPRGRGTRPCAAPDSKRSASAARGSVRGRPRSWI